ncbi:hypothetical protein [Burkholderia ubonensis]|uniref:hypothetical protein n=1 Tax=Burkholderia ubonensis TaxID=101571 RepID=UPI0008FDD2AF|nr:hypothetical protein [Burkholderia ubonensis]OJA59825.1 hypothetical protein BGV69_06790 [Burkholderia ubonensis]
MVNMSEMRALLAASPVEQPVAAPQNDTRFTHPGCDVCACPEGVCQADRSFFRQPAAAPADERAATFDQWKEKYADVFSNEGDAWYAWNAARAAASPAAEAVAIPVEVIAWRDAYQAHVDASTAYYSLLRHAPRGTDTSAEYQTMNEAEAKVKALIRPMYAALSGMADAPASPAAEDDNSITLDRRDLFDFVRGAIKSTLQDYKAGEGMTPSWYWQEATNRTEAVLEALDTKSPYIEAAPQPAQADAPADARPKCHGCPINPTCPSTSCGAPADAGEPIGQHDLSTSTGGRSTSPSSSRSVCGATTSAAISRNGSRPTSRAR